MPEKKEKKEKKSKDRERGAEKAEKKARAAAEGKENQVEEGKAPKKGSGRKEKEKKEGKEKKRKDEGKKDSSSKRRREDSRHDTPQSRRPHLPVNNDAATPHRLGGREGGADSSRRGQTPRAGKAGIDQPPLFSPSHRLSTVSNQPGSPRHSLRSNAAGPAHVIVVHEGDFMERQPGLQLNAVQDSAHPLPAKPGTSDFVGQYVQSALTGEFRQVSGVDADAGLDEEGQTVKRIVDKARKSAAEFRSVVISLTWAFSQLRVAIIAAFLMVYVMTGDDMEFIRAYSRVSNVLQKVINVVAFLTLAIALCLLAVINHYCAYFLAIERRKAGERRLREESGYGVFGHIQSQGQALMQVLCDSHSWLYYYHWLQALIYVAVFILCLVTAHYDDVLWEFRVDIRRDLCCNRPARCDPLPTPAPFGLEPTEQCPEPPGLPPPFTPSLCPEHTWPDLFAFKNHSAESAEDTEEKPTAKYEDGTEPEYLPDLDLPARTALFNEVCFARLALSVVGWFVGVVFNFCFYEDTSILLEEDIGSDPTPDHDAPPQRPPPRPTSPTHAEPPIPRITLKRTAPSVPASTAVDASNGTFGRVRSSWPVS
eukprot:TRINITY_DN21326_c0_g1_i1.p1 TRINITY_DN21326_c0_g1~~TRINITY_DN21326_c0_g1_i1.p1  ORF type:complete len:632 (+),score=192.29 TRINITY_DN21326_c0_g1_i1:117-1898(+)